ncbi:coiled-coil domain-containing protein 120 [Entelurus aequoreus]|uniref:coiled-coil domain-containing protein 120 n=1 Tax=Entelurus aequoreus TaxID=161455 RepID=UPI002B1D9732|nr:coiled-coil domain-containing protein 120 [Entelurus aequoreus]
MEVKGQLISAPAVVTCWDRKQRERMAELQEKRRSLQALLSVRLAELRRVCLQEAELTGALPADFPLATGEKPPSVKRRGGASCQANRKCRGEEEDNQRVKPKKTLFSGALRKHNDREHNVHTQHGKTTVHRGCHTDDTVRSESSSTSDSTGHDNDECVAQGRPLLVGTGSPVELFYPSKARRSSLCHRAELPEVLASHRPLLLQLPTPPRSHDSSPTSRPSEAARRGNSADGPPEEEEGGVARSGGGAVGPPEAGRGYGDLLLDYVLTKQRQRAKPHRPPPHYNGHATSRPPPVAPPAYRVHMGEQRRVKVTRTKSCGPFLPVSQADAHIQPDPHPHLLPPQPAPAQDARPGGAARNLHKALALEGLRDWYLRNTAGSSHADGKVKGQGGGTAQRRRTTHGLQGALPHSVTFHGHPLHGRSVDGSLYLDSAPPRKQEVPLREAPAEPTSPGTLV